jgi:hypothetical protein
MHFQKPIFAFDCKFNRYSTEDQAVYFSSSHKLNDMLTEVTTDELSVIATNMKQIAESRYTWKIINQMYEDTYL